MSGPKQRAVRCERTRPMGFLAVAHNRGGSPIAGDCHRYLSVIRTLGIRQSSNELLVIRAPARRAFRLRSSNGGAAHERQSAFHSTAADGGCRDVVDYGCAEPELSLKSRRHINLQDPAPPACRSRSRADREEPISWQCRGQGRPSIIRRPRDWPGNGRGMPNSGTSAATFAPLLFYPSWRPALADHFSSRAFARRQQLFDPARHRNAAWQCNFVDHDVLPCRGEGRFRPPRQNARGSAARKMHSEGSV